MPKTISTIGICTIGPRPPSHWKKLLSEKPIEVGLGSSGAGPVTMKMKSATTRMSARATTMAVVRPFFAAAAARVAASS